MSASQFFMELTTSQEQWESDARHLMAARVKFTVANWKQGGTKKINLLVKEFNYNYELNGARTKALFSPAQPN
jgi:hypothetical protein